MYENGGDQGYRRKANDRSHPYGAQSSADPLTYTAAGGTGISFSPFKNTRNKRERYTTHQSVAPPRPEA